MTFEIVKRIVVHDQTIGMLPGVTTAGNGDLLVSYATSLDRIAGSEAYVTRSLDGGQTWQEPRLVAKTKIPNGCIHLSIGMATLSDGTILLPYNDAPGDPWTHQITGYELCIIRSDDHGHHWSKEKIIHTELVAPMSYGKIIELHSGRLLLPLAGYYHEGECMRAGVLKSDDRGQTWGNYSTVAYDERAGMLDVGYGVKCPGGFNETSVIELDDGKLLALIRQDGGDETKDLFRAISSDDGDTWSYPEKLELCGTSPSLHRTLSGHLLLGYRTHVHEDSGKTEREAPVFRTDGVAISWSEDDGRTWQGRRLLEDPKDHRYKLEYEAGYPAMANLPHGDVLVVFYSYDEKLGIPANFPEPYKFYIAANVLREVS